MVSKLFDERFVEYLKWMGQQRKCSPLTLRNYRGQLREFGRLVLRDRPLESPSVTEIERFIRRPRVRYARWGAQDGECREPSAATISSDLAVIRSFYRWAMARGLVDHDPSALVVGPTVRNAQPKPIPDDDWGRLWRSDLVSDRDRLLLGFGFYGGLRRAEILSLTGLHVVLRDDDVRLVGYVRKGGSQDATPLATMWRTVDQMFPHLTAGSDWLGLVRGVAGYDGRLSHLHATNENALNYLMGKLCVRVGLPRYTPHQLRHSCATNLLRAGVPLPLVSKLLNHSSVQTTMRYARLGGDELAEWLSGKLGA